MTPLSPSRAAATSGIPSAAWFLSRLVRFRLALYLLNCLAITLVIASMLVPGLITRDVLDRLPLESGLGWIAWPIALLLASGLGRWACIMGCMFTNSPFILQNAALLQTNMLGRLLELPGARALEVPPGEAVSRFRDDVDEATGFPMGLNDLIGFLVYAAVALVVLLAINWRITLLVFLPLLLVVFLVNAVRQRIEDYRYASREATARVTGFIGESFGAVQAVQLADAEPAVVRRFEELNQERLRLTVRDKVFDQLVRSISSGSVELSTGAILLVTGRSLGGPAFTVGDFALFVYYLGNMAEVHDLLWPHAGWLPTGWRGLRSDVRPAPRGAAPTAGCVPTPANATTTRPSAPAWRSARAARRDAPDLPPPGLRPRHRGRHGLSATRVVHGRNRPNRGRQVDAAAGDAGAGPAR